jgi:dTDP-4-dehydrorhamnose reductase
LKILVTGSNGQLGQELARLLKTGQAEIGPIPSAYKDAVVDFADVDTLDITDAAAVMAKVHEGAYDLIINCAAFTNVDGCETNFDIARAVNALGPRNLALAAAEVDAKFVQVSTDYVFAGNEPGERVESDATGPISAYGTTKLEGEMLVAEATPKHFIVRTAWLYGYVGKNFVKTMKRLGESHDVVTVVDDQLGNPTSANDLAYEILKIALTDNYGIYHATNNGTCSWAQFAQAIMEGFKLDCKVEPVTSEQYKAANPQSADRPAFSSLINKHLQDTVGDEMRPWQDALASYIQNFDELNG